jgi:IS30 family transposase
MTDKENKFRSKLTMEDAQRIRALKDTYSYSRIAEAFNVHVNTIKQIVKNKTYKENDTK